MTIRRVLEADAGEIAIVLRETGWFSDMALETLEQTRARVKNHIAACRVGNCHSIWVAQVPGVGVVGYVAIHWQSNLFLTRPEGNVSELFVIRAHRGTGVGRQLLQAAADEARRRGCCRLSLVTNRNRESYARKFYSNSGWVERREMANFVFTL